MWNMNNQKKYRFGHTVFGIQSPILPKEDPQLAPFAVEEEAHHVFRVVPALEGEGGMEREPYPTSVRRGGETLVYVRDLELLRGYALSLFLNHHKAYDILVERHALVLHASYVEREGMALLFSAPSGTGKSTQAHFWKEERGCRIINEDRVVLFKQEGVWYAGGCWSMGGARLTANVTRPLDTLVLLQQGREDRAETIRPSEALRRLIPQCAYTAEDGVMRQEVITILCDLLSDTRVVSYACMNHPDSVGDLEKVLWKK